MAQYGMIYTANEAKRQLLEESRDITGAKTWQNLYGNISTATTAATEAATYDYSKALSEAYKSAYSQQQAIAKSNLGMAAKSDLQYNTDIALEEAFQSYQQNYANRVANIQEQGAKAIGTVDVALQQQAQGMSNLYNSVFDYYEWMAQQSGAIYNEATGRYEFGDMDEDNLFRSDVNWSKFVREEEDEAGNAVKYLISPGQLKAPGTTESGEPTGLFDAQGMLTEKGTDFFDQMFNYMSSRKGEVEDVSKTFGAWLAENNPEVFDFINAADPYNFTYDGTNFGTFKTMVGLKSIDDYYSFAERNGGLDKAQLNAMFESFTSDFSNLKGSKKKQAETVRTAIIDYVDKMEQLGFASDELTEFKEKAIAADEKVLGGGARWLKAGGTIFKESVTGLSAGTAGGAAGGAAAGAILGGTAGSVIPVAGTAAGAGAGAAAGAATGATVGAVFGSIAGAGAGVIEAIYNDINTASTNKSSVNDLKKMYLNLVNTTIAAATK